MTRINHTAWIKIRSSLMNRMGKMDRGMKLVKRVSKEWDRMQIKKMTKPNRSLQMLT